MRQGARPPALYRGIFPSPGRPRAPSWPGSLISGSVPAGRCSLAGRSARRVGARSRPGSVGCKTEARRVRRLPAPPPFAPVAPFGERRWLWL